MSKSYVTDSIRCDLGHSRGLTVLWCLLFGGAVLIVMWMPMAWGWRLLLAIALAGGFFDSLSSTAWRRGRRAVTAISVDGDGRVEMRIGPDGEWHDVELAHSTVLAPVVFLPWRPVGRRWWRGQIIPADALPADCFRRLRAALRRRRSPA